MPDFSVQPPSPRLPSIHSPLPHAEKVLRRSKTNTTAAGETYFELICTENDRLIIHDIISTVGGKKKLSLLLDQSRLWELEQKIKHVHPLKFLETIFLDPHLKDCLNKILSDRFKRVPFMQGLGPSLTREQENGRLDVFIDDFASELGVPKEPLVRFFGSRDWEGLVRFLSMQ